MNNRIKINESDIVDTVTLCPYCMSEPKSDLGCCGESSAHFDKAYITKDDEYYLTSEVEIISNDRNDQSPKMAEIKHESYNS